MLVPVLCQLIINEITFLFAHHKMTFVSLNMTRLI